MTYTLDAKNKKLGRLASEIALILQGKKNAGYNPRLEGKDEVIVKNIKEIEISGRKRENKVYYRHSTYVGHLKKKTFRQIFEKDPSKVLKLAVKNMLPKNRLQSRRMKRLKIE